ncbi:MAG: 3-oxoadipyl-CoA thiolase [Neomegalonema sp.]|nr:3-oxoadipyl-CoA thiolase [Neomegalonema sp.]
MSDAFICDYVRTPIGRYGGALASVRTDDLAAMPLRALLTRNPGLDPAAIEEVWLGCANQAGEDNRNVARMALLLAGLPQTVPGVSVNRLCGSGLEAVAAAARAVRAGEMELAIAGGVESMTRAPFVIPKSAAPWGRATEIHDTTIGWRFVNPVMEAAHGIDSMPQTAQNLADEQGISRQDQDAFALRSQERTAQAQANGRLAAEILPVEVPLGRGKTQEVSADEHPRATSLADLARLKPITRPDGSITAGNASGVNDGAAALIVASRAAVERFSLTPRARIVGAASAGVAPRIMGIGPVPAIRQLCARTGIGLDGLGLIELNEAFAAQALAVLRGLGIADDDPRVNPNGGAIALGHPLGMSGARIAGSAALDLSRGAAGGQRYALATMCVGVGQGAAMLLEKV